MGLRDADTWFREGSRFVKATGIYDNFSVAHGQDTEAWVTKQRSSVLAAALGVQRAAQREVAQLRKRKAAWNVRIEPLVRFLRGARARTLRIRHHYAWN